MKRARTTGGRRHRGDSGIRGARLYVTPETGKDPRRSPKWFKKAEIDTRELLKRLEAFDHEMSFSDRPMLEKVKAKVQQVHDDLLVGLMEGKHK